ncbi:MAG: precorrin-6y C5,15-methyltransferase (decarboxylating) subunit CbiE [Pseudomonadota bacterium]
MADTPWLTIVGIGEDGPDGLAPEARRALGAAEVIVGPPRHLGLLPALNAEHIEWPVPYADGVPILLAQRGRQTVALASGDPFFFGAGAILAQHLDRGEWSCVPARSCFSLAASRLGWPLQSTACRGLHAAPVARLRPDLAQGARIIATMRDGATVADLARWLTAEGFGATQVHILEALGGPRERIRAVRAVTGAPDDVIHPVAVALEVAGGLTMPRTSGLADTWFDHDGQITKRPVRALTLSALAPLPGEHLWDIGAGSGSISIEWLLSTPTARATAVEPREDRAERIRANAARLGADRLHVVAGAAPAALDGLDPPQAVFVGGGLDASLLADLEARLPTGTRLVANAVTVESEALLLEASSRLGGDVVRFALSHLEPLGSKRGWDSARPIVQWSVTL